MYLARYLLSIEEFMEQEKGEALMERAFFCVDDTRRRKAERIKPGRARAASLGAGLLLQMAVREAVCAYDGNAAGQKSETQKAEASGDAVSREHELRQYSATQLLTRIERESCLPLVYEYGDNGKPYFQKYPFYFSLSHSGEYVLCALSDMEIGADIQQHCGKNVKKLAERFYSSREAAAIEQAGAAEERLFYRLWVRKEAYGKLTGRGVAEVLNVDLLPTSEAVSEKENAFNIAEALPKGAGVLTETILLKEKNLPPVPVLSKGTGFLSETILQGGERLIWEEYGSVEGYSIVLCRYG